MFVNMNVHAYDTIQVKIAENEAWENGIEIADDASGYRNIPSTEGISDDAMVLQT